MDGLTYYMGAILLFSINTLFYNIIGFWSFIAFTPAIFIWGRIGSQINNKEIE